MKIFQLCLALMLWAAPVLAAEKVYIVSGDATWPPMEHLDNNKQVVGYSIDYIEAVAKEAGIKIQIRNEVWDGIFAALESRQSDILASSVTITEKRKKAMAFTDPYCSVYQAIVVPIGSPIKSMADLAGKKIGGQIGTTGLVETMPKSSIKAQIKTYDEVGLALEDLVKGTLDAVICDDPVAKYYANTKKEYKNKMYIAFLTDDPEHYGFALRKNDTATRDLLNKGIAAVKAKGIEKEIIKKWLGE